MVTVFWNVEASNVTGNAYLDNLSVHEGILIEFIPDSPSSVYSSGNSNPDGSFQVTVENGIYDVIYSRSGYQTVTLENVFISTDLILQDITLSSKPVKSISGQISGLLYQDTVYSVTGNLTIPSGYTLEIQPGTVVEFIDFCRLIVNGKLIADGSSDSITFTSGKSTKNQGDWDGIFIYSADTTIIKNCILEFGGSWNNETAIINTYSAGIVNISESTIRNSDRGGVYIFSGFGTIQDNVIVNTRRGGVYVAYSGDGLIQGNKISLGTSYGIWVSDASVVAKHNEIFNCGVGIYADEEALFSYNLIYNNTSGIYVYSGVERPLIQNNTIFSNTYGVRLYDEPYSTPDIVNNIFYANQTAIYRSAADSGYPTLLEYNLFSNNTTNLNGAYTGFGVIITTNNNGTDSDTYFNIFEDPEFESYNENDSTFTLLSSISPAINAGNPDFSDIDGSISDIGAFPKVIPQNFNLIGSEFFYYPDSIVLSLAWQNSIDNDEVSYLLTIFNHEIDTVFTPLLDTTFSINTGQAFEPSTYYNWFVSAYDLQDTTLSDTLTFYIPDNEAPGTFYMYNPNATELDSTIFSWSLANDVDPVFYFMTLAGDDMDSTFEIGGDTLIVSDGTSYLIPNYNYELFVLATDTRDSTYSDTLSFTVPNIPPGNFTLIGSENRLTIESNDISFSWTTSDDLESITYTLSIYNDESETNFEGITDLETVIDGSDFLIPNQSYQWFVIASDEMDLTYSDTLSFIVPNIPPGNFTLIGPENSSTIESNNEISFSWTSSDDLESITYTLSIYNDESETNFEGITDLETVIDGSDFLIPNQSYQWFVIASDEMDLTYSDTLSFIVPNIPPGNFTLIGPENSSTIESNNEISFSWTSSDDLESITYTLSIYNDESETNFEGITDLETVIDGSDFLIPNQSYQWFVIASDEMDLTYSDTLSFIVPNIPPGNFTLIGPENSSTIESNNEISFSWTSSDDLESITYTLSIYNDESETNFEGITDLETVIDGSDFLIPNQSYQWFVIASDEMDLTYSDTLSFIVPNIPPGNFTLIGPENSSTIESNNEISFSWTSSDDLESITYTLSIYNDESETNFEGITDLETVIDGSDFLIPNQSYQWFVIASDEMDLTYSDTLSFQTEKVLSIDQAIPKIKLFPNPSSTLLNVQLNDYNDGLIVLKDLSGKTIMKSTWRSKSVIDVSTITEGIYVLFFEDKDGKTVVSSKILIK